jgi:hypothetical protein
VSAVDDRSRAVAALCDPDTRPAVLRAVVQRYPDLRAAADEHPAAFPGLFRDLPPATATPGGPNPTGGAASGGFNPVSGAALGGSNLMGGAASGGSNPMGGAAPVAPSLTGWTPPVGPLRSDANLISPGQGLPSPWTGQPGPGAAPAGWAAGSGLDAAGFDPDQVTGLGQAGAAGLAPETVADADGADDADKAVGRPAAAIRTRRFRLAVVGVVVIALVAYAAALVIRYNDHGVLTYTQFTRLAQEGFPAAFGGDLVLASIETLLEEQAAANGGVVAAADVWIVLTPADPRFPSGWGTNQANEAQLPLLALLLFQDEQQARELAGYLERSWSDGSDPAADEMLVKVQSRTTGGVGVSRITIGRDHQEEMRVYLAARRNVVAFARLFSNGAFASERLDDWDAFAVDVFKGAVDKAARDERG